MENAYSVPNPLLALPLLAQSTDEAAIRDVVKKYVDARERRDPKSIEALFTADADQLVSTGEWRKGRGDLGSIRMTSNGAPWMRSANTE